MASGTYIALDPGGTTGVAVMDVSKRIRTFQIEGGRHHKDLYKVLIDHMPNKLIVESFVYQKRSNVSLVSREYIGIAELYTQMTDTELIMQPPMGNNNGLWTDDKLKECYLYETAMPHANDAARHMLYYMTTVEKDMKWVRMTRSMDD